MSGGFVGLLRNAAAMLKVGLLQRVLGLIQVMILSRVLEANGLGAFTFVQSTANTFAGMTRLGVDAGVHVELASLKLPEGRERAEIVLGEAVSVFLLVSAVVAAALVVFARPIASGLFAAPELWPYVIVSAALLVSQMFAQLCYVAFAGLHAFTRYSRITMVSSIGWVALSIVGGLTYGAWGGVIGLALGQSIGTVMLAAGLLRETAQHGVSLRPRWPGAAARTLLGIGLPFYLSVAAVIPAEFMSLGLLSRSAGIEALGELRVVQSLMSLAAFVPVALAGPIISHLVAAHTGDGTPDAVHAQLKFNWILGLLMVEGLAVVWGLAIDVVYGGTYPAARSIGVLALAAFVPNMPPSVMTAAVLAR